MHAGRGLFLKNDAPVSTFLLLTEQVSKSTLTQYTESVSNLSFHKNLMLLLLTICYILLISNSTIGDESTLEEQSTRYTRQLVLVKREKEYMGIGAILSKNIIITDYAEDLVNNTKVKAFGYIEFGIQANKKIYPENNRRKWRKAINYINNGKYGLNEPGIALIKLNRDINMKRDLTEPILLADSEPEDGSACSVITWGQFQENIVQLKVFVLNQTKCKEKIPNLFNEALCIILPDHNHCTHLAGGDPVICKGRLTGIVNQQYNCHPTIPRAAASISSFLPWIMSTQKKLAEYPPKLADVSKYSKYAVYLGWQNKRDVQTLMACGIILSKDIVLTSYTNEVKNEDIHDKHKKINGYVVYGLAKYLKNSPKANLLSWDVSINYERDPFAQPFGVQLALIKTNNNMKFDKRANPMPLPRKQLDENADCVVVGLINTSVILETKAIIIPEKECVEQFKDKIYNGAICVDLPPDSDMEESHCSLFFNGSPLVCNGELAGVISWQGICNGSKPHLATSVYKFRDWITDQMKQLETSSNIRQEPKITVAFFLIYVIIENKYKRKSNNLVIHESRVHKMPQATPRETQTYADTLGRRSQRSAIYNLDHPEENTWNY
uniref:Peptidase S1 domain-containing protein n=1 Tax=Glossina palpalis gambiensis TaxID=67801 RepID=A0A1B0BEK9_9MUSC